MTGAKTGRRGPGSTLEQQLERLLADVRAGKVDARLDAGAFQPEDVACAAHVNAVMDQMVGPLRLASRSLGELAQGSIPEFIIDEFQGEFDVLKRNINNLLATMHGMHHEAQNLLQSVKEGRLRTRGNDWDFQGNWRQLIAGMNDVVDAFQDPFQVASACVRSISNGQVPAPITAPFKGDYRLLARDLNNLIGTVVHITNSVLGLARSAVAGELNRRVDATAFQGDWRALVDGLNHTLDAALAPVQEAGAVLERVSHYDLTTRMLGEYAGDHARIKDALNLSAATLERALQQVAESTGRVASEGQRIAESAASASMGSTRQTHAVDAIAARMRDLSGHAREHATRTAGALDDAQHAKAAAESGKRRAEQMLEVMGQIDASAQSTGAILQEINKVAEQTDQLATDATVQAGKVATSGRGFVVVAAEVGKLAKRSRDAADHMERLLKDVVMGTDEVARKRADSISSVIGEIQEISLQTKMLALNAAVEAAHVSAASEEFERNTVKVKALANQAKDAARQTEGLAHAAQSAAGAGRDLAQGVDGGMSTAVERVSRIALFVDAAARLGRQLLGDVDMVTHAVADIREVTQSNAAAAAESSAVADTLNQETDSLSALVGRFTLANGPH